MTAHHRGYYTAQRLADFTDRSPGRSGEHVMPLAAWLLQPYLDLAPAHTPPLHALGVEISYAQLVDEELPFFAPQTHPQARFRAVFLTETRLEAYRVEHPAQLANELRTRRWQRLVEIIEDAADATTELRLRLAVCLNALGLYGATTAVVRPVPDADIVRAPSAALLAMKRAHAAWKANPHETNERENVRVLELAARTRGAGQHHVRLRAAVTLAVYFAKRRRRDEAAVAKWRRVAAREYARLRPDEDWRDILYASAFWRGVSFLPFIAGDHEVTRRELDCAEAFARSADTSVEVRRMLADQNLHPLLETRTKEALWAGDRDLAVARARELVRLDPFDPKVHVALGDVLGDDDVEAALASYRAAARLGPPFTALAYFRIGRCLERLDHAREACYAYQRALEADPLGATPRQRLAELEPPSETQRWLHELETIQRGARAAA